MSSVLSSQDQFCPFWDLLVPGIAAVQDVLKVFLESELGVKSNA